MTQYVYSHTGDVKPNGAIARIRAARERVDVSGDSLGERVKETRTAAGISQAGLADLIGVRPATVYRYEKGMIQPSADAVVRLAEVLGVSVRFLVTGNAEPIVQEPPAYPALGEFLDSIEGQTVTPDEEAQLRSVRWRSAPTVLSYHYVLAGIRAQEPLSAEDAQWNADVAASVAAKGGRVRDR